MQQNTSGQWLLVYVVSLNGKRRDGGSEEWPSEAEARDAYRGYQGSARGAGYSTAGYLLAPGSDKKIKL